jgi:HK97 family phage major capsid protein
MALKQLLIGKKISDLRAQLETLLQTRDNLVTRRAEMKRREEELEASVNEITEETSQEDRDALDALTQEWEGDDAALTQEENDNQQAREGIETQIAGLEQELSAINARMKAPAAQQRTEARKDETNMNTRKIFFGMNHQERDAFFAREDVTKFLGNVRAAIREKRTVTGTDAIIPTVVMDLVRERVTEYSKLLKHVNVQRVSGDARIPVMGIVPDAVWTEMCANLNEIDLSFGMVTMDGFKVGGYVAVCNAVLEDSNVDLASAIIESLGKAMGRAIDKAILYGTGTKMPTGILTALLASTYASTNVVAISGKEGIELFKAIVEAIGETSNDYTSGGMFFAMNEKTKTKLMTNAMNFSAAGAIVTGQNGEMPVIGGKIETLGFIPDDVIIGGYGELYAMLERAGMTFARSEHVRFTQDQTVFKGTGRYDGKPVIDKGFVAIGIGGVKPEADAVTFAEDKANA